MGTSKLINLWRWASKTKVKQTVWYREFSRHAGFGAELSAYF